MTITSTEVAEQLKRALRGEIAVRLANPECTWDGMYAGDVAFRFGDWEIVFFNDCDELDYTDSATAPDGRKADYDDWRKEVKEPQFWRCPLDHLTEDEMARLENMLSSAT